MRSYLGVRKTLWLKQGIHKSMIDGHIDGVASFVAPSKVDADEPVEACPPTAAYRLRKFARKHKVALRTVGVIALLLLVAAVVSVWQAVRATRAEALAREARRLAEINAERARLHAQSSQSERDVALAARDALDNARYASEMNLLQAAWDEGHVVRARELLRRQIPSAGQPDRRGFEWYYWDGLCNTKEDTFQLEGRVRFVAPYF